MDSNVGSAPKRQNDNLDEIPYYYPEVSSLGGAKVTRMSAQTQNSPTPKKGERRKMRDIAAMDFPHYKIDAPIHTVLPLLPKDGALIMIVGTPGSMKSTTLFALSEYCARRIGKTCYVFGEEKSASFTVKEKITLSGAELAELIDHEEFANQIKPDRGYFERSGYKVVFLDSKDSFKLNVKYLLELVRDNPNVIFFIVSHINGKGEIHGGKDFEHAIDLELKTTKIYQDNKSVCYISMQKTRLGGESGAEIPTMDIINHVKKMKNA